MMTLSLVKSDGGFLVPFSNEDKEFLDKRRVGAVLEFESPKAVRNPKFHRKYMALLNLGFDYWTPKGGAIAPSEEAMLNNFVKYLGSHLGYQDTLDEMSKTFLDVLKTKRANYEVEKSFTVYRKWVAAEAGFFNVVILPNGAIRKEAKSISFANMDDDEFEHLYKESFNVLWNQILRFEFRIEKEVENAINSMLGYV